MLDPQAYDAWYETSVGVATLEHELALLRRICPLQAGDRVLEVGCGTGRFIGSIAPQVRSAVGIDPSEQMIEFAQNNVEGVSFEVASSPGLPFANGEFDVVFECTVLSFVDDPVATVTDMVRVTRDGGSVFVGDLNRWSPWQMRRRLRGWLGRGSFAGVRFFGRRELMTMLRTAGLEHVKSGTAVYFPDWNVSRNALHRLERLGRWAWPWAGAFVAACGQRPQ